MKVGQGFGSHLNGLILQSPARHWWILLWHWFCYELSFLETHQDRTGGDAEPEQVGWVAVAWATGSEVHHRTAWAEGNGRYSRHGVVLHEQAR